MQGAVWHGDDNKTKTLCHDKTIDMFTSALSVCEQSVVFMSFTRWVLPCATWCLLAQDHIVSVVDPWVSWSWTVSGMHAAGAAIHVGSVFLLVACLFSVWWELLVFEGLQCYRSVDCACGERYTSRTMDGRSGTLMTSPFGTSAIARCCAGRPGGDIG